MADAIDFGLMLPHFGEHPTADQLSSIAKRAEDLGFDSLWARDHLYIPPENSEHGGIVEKEFLECFQTLAHVNATTEDMTLGTGVANAHRRPLKVSQHVGTLDRLSEGQVVCGVGAGTFEREFTAMDLPFDRQGQMTDELLEILRLTFSETNVSYDGEVFAFEDVTINPRPGESVPIWYGGLSEIAVKRAFRYADCWFPGRTPLPILDERLETLAALESEYDRTIDRSYVTIFSVAEDSGRARARLNLPQLVEDVNTLHGREFDTPEDITGSYVAGTPAECIDMLDQIVGRGFDHIVLDARHHFDELEDVLALTGEAVIPAFR